MVLLASILDPLVVIPTTVEKGVFQDIAGGNPIYVYWVGFFVRDMGTATFVRLGKNGNLVDTLIGQYAYSEYDVPAGYAFDAQEMHIISDSNDAVIEVTGMRLGT